MAQELTTTGAPPSYFDENVSKKTCLVCTLDYVTGSGGFYTAGCEGCDPAVETCCVHYPTPCGGCCAAGACDKHV